MKHTTIAMRIDWIFTMVIIVFMAYLLWYSNPIIITTTCCILFGNSFVHTLDVYTLQTPVSQGCKGFLFVCFGKFFSFAISVKWMSEICYAVHGSRDTIDLRSQLIKYTRSASRWKGGKPLAEMWPAACHVFLPRSYYVVARCAKRTVAKCRGGKEKNETGGLYAAFLSKLHLQLIFQVYSSLLPLSAPVFYPFRWSAAVHGYSGLGCQGQFCKHFFNKNSFRGYSSCW